MNIAVLVKMVPDTESRLEVRDGQLDESGFKYMVNPYDEFAVEQAVQFKEAAGGKVTLVALFSEASSIDTDLRKMLAIGCDEAIVLRQPNYRGDRPAANAAALAGAHRAGRGRGSRDRYARATARPRQAPGIGLWHSEGPARLPARRSGSPGGGPRAARTRRAPR